MLIFIAGIFGIIAIFIVVILKLTKGRINFKWFRSDVKDCNPDSCDMLYRNTYDVIKKIGLLYQKKSQIEHREIFMYYSTIEPTFFWVHIRYLTISLF